MIKLSSILNEIKLIPASIDNKIKILWDEIYGNAKKKNFYLFTNYINSQYLNFNSFERGLSLLNDKRKQELYNELKNYKDNKINEIKLYQSPSSEKILALYTQILIILEEERWDYWDRKQLKKELVDITIKNGRRRENFKDWVKTLNITQLNNLFNDLLSFRNKIDKTLHEVRLISKNSFSKDIEWIFKVNSKEELKKILQILDSLGYEWARDEEEENDNGKINPIKDSLTIPQTFRNITIYIIHNPKFSKGKLRILGNDGQGRYKKINF